MPVPICGHVVESCTELDAAGSGLLDFEGRKVHAGPGEAHMRLVRGALCDLRGKEALGLVYDFRRPPVRPGLYGFFDASHADD